MNLTRLSSRIRPQKAESVYLKHFYLLADKNKRDALHYALSNHQNLAPAIASDLNDVIEPARHNFYAFVLAKLVIEVDLDLSNVLNGSGLLHVAKQMLTLADVSYVHSEFGVEVIAPHRRNRKKENKTQDGRKLRRYKKRWRVERFFAWLGNFRRLLIRHERKVAHFQAFVHLATIIILVKNGF